VQRADLFECVRERVMSDIVKQRCRSHDVLLFLADGDRILGFAKERESPAGEVVRPQRVLESGMRCAGVNEIRPAQLANVAQALKDFGVDEPKRELIDADVVPDRVAQDLEAHGPLTFLGGRYAFGPAFFVAVSTLSNLSKFSRNIAASFFACAS